MKFNRLTISTLLAFAMAAGISADAAVKDLPVKVINGEVQSVGGRRSESRNDAFFPCRGKCSAYTRKCESTRSPDDKSHGDKG